MKLGAVGDRAVRTVRTRFARGAPMMSHSAGAGQLRGNAAARLRPAVDGAERRLRRPALRLHLHLEAGRPPADCVRQLRPNRCARRPRARTSRAAPCCGNWVLPALFAVNVTFCTRMWVLPEFLRLKVSARPCSCSGVTDGAALGAVASTNTGSPIFVSTRIAFGFFGRVARERRQLLPLTGGRCARLRPA